MPPYLQFRRKNRDDDILSFPSAPLTPISVTVCVFLLPLVFLFSSKAEEKLEGTFSLPPLSLRCGPRKEKERTRKNGPFFLREEEEEENDASGVFCSPLNLFPPHSRNLLLVSFSGRLERGGGGGGGDIYAR